MSLKLVKFTMLPLVAVLFYTPVLTLVAMEEISEYWGSVRVYLPAPSSDGQPIVTRAEEASTEDVPGGKRAFRLPGKSGAFLRFNPTANATQSKDLSSAMAIKVRIYATCPTFFSVRLAGGGPSVGGKMEHSGSGWELLELPLDAASLAADNQGKLNTLSEITLVDLIVTGEVAEGAEFIVSEFSAE